MPRKDEKISGVYEFSNTTTNMSYIGKSTCIGSTVRSVKSRLNSGKFHNKKMQAEFSIHGLGSYTVEKYIPAGNENINDLLQRIRNEVVEDGYELWYRQPQSRKTKHYTQISWCITVRHRYKYIR